MTESSIKRVPVVKVKDLESVDTFDALAIEEPLEIRLEYSLTGDRMVQNSCVTMRTPDHDAELASRFLFTEGIETNLTDIANIDHIIDLFGTRSSLAVQLSEKFNITLAGFLRDQRFNIYTAAHRVVIPSYENTH